MGPASTQGGMLSTSSLLDAYVGDWYSRLPACIDVLATLSTFDIQSDDIYIPLQRDDESKSFESAVKIGRELIMLCDFTPKGSPSFLPPL